MCQNNNDQTYASSNTYGSNVRSKLNTCLPTHKSHLVQFQDALKKMPSAAESRLFIRHRANATSVRLRRRKIVTQSSANGGAASENEAVRPKQQDDNDDDVDGDEEEVGDEEFTEISQKASNARFRSSSFFTGGDFEDNWTLKMSKDRRWRRPRTYSDEWDKASEEEEEEEEEEGGDVGDDDEDEENDDTKRATAFGSHRRDAAARKSMNGLLKCSPMETLDRRISASSDQLDTLKREKRVKKLILDDNNNQHHMNMNHNVRARARSASRQAELGEESSSSRQQLGKGQQGQGRHHLFFFERHPQAHQQPRGRNRWRQHHHQREHVFLSEDGPYSRHLYGPPPPEVVAQPASVAQIDEERRRRRARSYEALAAVAAATVTATASSDNMNNNDDDDDDDEEQVSAILFSSSFLGLTLSFFVHFFFCKDCANYRSSTLHPRCFAIQIPCVSTAS